MLDALDTMPQFHTARLTVNVAQASAIALCRRAGFEIVTAERNRMGDGADYEEHVMQRAFGPAVDNAEPPTVG